MLKNALIFMLVAMFGTSGNVACMPDTEKFYTDSYSGTGTAETVYQTITYDSYTSDYTHVDIYFPVHLGSYGTNACACVAGAMAITYYDVTYTNLIPDYDPGYYWNDRYYFTPQNSAINSVQEELYNLMGTNTVEAGTSVPQFKSGMTQYFNNQGYSISYNQLSPSTLDTTSSTYFEQETPIILFLSSYEYYPSGGISNTDTEMSLVGYKKTVGHVVVAYGYMVYNFYNDGELFKTDKYLAVSFGDNTTGLLALTSNTTIDEAYTFNVA